MMSVTCFNRRFTPNWKMTILACLAILFFGRLGFWQVHRADEKKQMLAVQASYADKAPIAWSTDMVNPQQYQRIIVEGQFLNEKILLDNQHHNHQFGYNVITPLLLTSGKVVLIDRGWVAGDMARQQFPVPQIPDKAIQILGNVYYPSSKSWVLGPVVEEKQQNIRLIERIDTQLISQFLHKPVYPFIIRLDKDEEYGYVREWAVVAMPPERHYAYALQWFAMAGVVLILFIALNLKKANKNGKA